MIFKSLIKRSFQKHFRTDGEPKKTNFLTLIRAPLSFLIFIVIVVVTSNMMPFYNDGSRMGLLDGLETVFLEKAGGFTAPYNIPKQDHKAFTNIEPIEEVIPNEGYFIFVNQFSEKLQITRSTGAVIFLIAILMIFSFVIGIFEFPFTFSEKKLYKDAFNTKISNTRLRVGFLPTIMPAMLVDLVLATIISVGFFNMFELKGEEEAFRIMGLRIYPFMFIAIAFFMFYAVKHAFSARKFLKNLLSRRCEKCFHMDTTIVIDKEYVRTDVTTTTHYTTSTAASGVTSRKKTGESTNEHDVYKYTYQCQNCGYTFKQQF